MRLQSEDQWDKERCEDGECIRFQLVSMRISRDDNEETCVVNPYVGKTLFTIHELGFVTGSDPDRIIPLDQCATFEGTERALMAELKYLAGVDLIPVRRVSQEDGLTFFRRNWEA